VHISLPVYTYTYTHTHAHTVAYIWHGIASRVVGKAYASIL